MLPKEVIKTSSVTDIAVSPSWFLGKPMIKVSFNNDATVLSLEQTKELRDVLSKMIFLYEGNKDGN